MEQVNHPKHYQKNGKECIDVMEEDFGTIATICFSTLNDFKYDWRKGAKEGNSYQQDINKGIWYAKFALSAYKRLNFFQKISIRIFFRGVYKKLMKYKEEFVY